MTNGETLLAIADRLETHARSSFVNCARENYHQAILDAKRLREIAEQMLKDEKYPAVRS